MMAPEQWQSSGAERKLNQIWDIVKSGKSVVIGTSRSMQPSPVFLPYTWTNTRSAGARFEFPKL